MSLIPLQVDASHGGTGINALTGPPAADKVLTTQGDGTYALETQSGDGSGDFGGAMTLEFVFSDDITAGDPGTSKLALNAAAPNQHTSTVLVVDDQDANATVISQTLAIWDDSTSTIKGFLRIVAKGDASKWIVFSFTSLTQPSGYTSFALTYVNASYTSFADGDAVLLCFDRTGDAGVPGADGADGTGLIPLFDDIAPVGNVGTGEDTLFTHSLPALSANGDKVFFEYGCTLEGDVLTSGRLRLHLDISSDATINKIYDSGAVSMAGGINISVSISGWIIRTQSDGFSAVVRAVASDLAGTNVTLISVQGTGPATGNAMDWTSANVLRLTGETTGTGTDDNDVAGIMGSIWKEPAA